MANISTVPTSPLLTHPPAAAPLNLLYVATSYPPAIGGAQLHLHEMAKLMQRAGHKIQVSTMAGRYRTDWLRMSTICADPERVYTHEGISVYQVGFSTSTKLGMLPWFLGYYGAMGTSVKHISSIIEHKLREHTSPPSLIHSTRIGREFLSRAACNLAAKQDIPFLISANHHPRWSGPLYREQTRIYGDADAVIALCEHERQVLARLSGRNEESIYVTGIGPILSDSYSVEEFRLRYGINRRYVLYLGQQFPYKGVIAVAEAAEIVFRRHPDVQFVFAGPHTPASSRYFSKSTDSRVVNLGSVDLETKTAALAGCDLLCLPSTQESFGGVFVEAWSFKKPVIGGSIPALAELISDGEDGLLTAQKPEEIAGRISDLLRDAQTRERMGLAGWKKVQQKYTWPKLAQGLQAIYRDVIAGRVSRRTLRSASADRQI